MGKDKNKKVIGVVCAGIHEEGVQNTVLGLLSSINEHGCKAVVISTFTYYNSGYNAGEVSIFRLLRANVFDGYVLMPETIKSDEVWADILADTKATGKPFICIDRDVPDCPSIIYDYGGAFEQIVRHMLEVHKPKRINFIGGMENNSFSEERLNVFKKVMAENGREFEEERFGYGQFWEYPTYDVMNKFMASGLEMPDCIICCNDAEAIAVIKYLRDRNIQVPENIILSGFDGIEEEKYIVPRLTTAACDFDAICRKAVTEIINGINGREMTRLSSVRYNIRISQSCGCKPLSDTEKTNKLMQLYNRINHMAFQEKTMFDYSGHMAELKDYEQLAQLMPQYTWDNAWVCINPSFLYDKTADNNSFGCFDDQMLMFAHMNSGLKERDITFPTTGLLPNIENVLEEVDSLLFVPMGFQGETVGYTAVEMGIKDFNFLYTHRFVSNTNRILETLKTRVRLQNAYAKVADMHMRDPMTGIYNRRGFYMRMADLTEDGSSSFWLFSADLDGLKTINDSYGHSAGDTAIIAAAEAVSRAAGENAVCARFGGDEFIVVIPTPESGFTEQDYISAVRREVDAFNKAGRALFRLGISIGGSALKITDRENIDKAMKKADKRMYECKKKHHISASKASADAL